MLISGIKSRPEYHGLTIDPYARRHLFALGGEGAMALLDKPELKDAAFRARTEVLYVAEGSGHADALRSSGIAGPARSTPVSIFRQSRAPLPAIPGLTAQMKHGFDWPRETRSRLSPLLP